MVGLKHRLLAPELVEEFVRTFVAEVNAANRERGQRQTQLQQEWTKLGRQIRNLLELIKDGHGSPAMARELRGNLAAFLYLPETEDAADMRTAAPRKGNGRSEEVVGTLVAGTRNPFICVSGWEKGSSALSVQCGLYESVDSPRTMSPSCAGG
jgi:hypothetical protein